MAYDQMLLLLDSCGFVDVGRSDERTGLSFARVAISSNKSVVSIYNWHFFSFGATAPILALAYLHETVRFTAVY
jgi:hypothetical protein